MMINLAHFASNGKKKIDKIRRPVLYILILIVCLVIPSQMREIDRRRSIFSRSRQTVIITLPIISPNCKVETRLYYIELASCDQFDDWPAIEVVGRLAGQTDEEPFSKKRLIVESISPLSASSHSLIGWRLLFNHQLQRIQQGLFNLVLASTNPYQAALVLAVGFGHTDWLVPTIKPYFETTGTLHILAASGQNIALLTSLSLAVIPGLIPRKFLGALLLGIIFLYVFLVGLEPSIVRASAMATHLILARYIWHRQSVPLFSLLISSLSLLIIFPEWLYAIGFQLSVMASFGIIVLYPHINRLASSIVKLIIIKRAPICQKLITNIGQYWLSLFGAGIAAQLATLVILVKNFGVVLLLSFIPSAIVGSVVPSLLNFAFFGLFVLSVLQTFPHPQLIDQLIGVVAFWLPADLFIHLLKYCSRYSWGKVEW